MLLSVIDSPPSPSPASATGPRSIDSVQLLRVSITDRCNFRCTYCMPETGVAWLAKENILSFDEIVRVVRAGVEHHGIRSIKLTGGEPTLRHDLIQLVQMLRKIDGINDLSMTTNGMLLENLAEPLKQAGLDRITISIDSLHPDRFKSITRTGDLPTVLRGLDRTLNAGFLGTKINCVAMQGINDDEFPAFARLTLDHPVTVRFIEYMPLGDAAILHPSEQGPASGCGGQDRGVNAFIPESQIRHSIESELGRLIPVWRETEPGVGPAKIFQLPNAAGRLGFISAMSAPFCSTCNRLRLTADGLLRSCLFDGGEIDVRSLLRNNATSSQLADAMTQCVQMKPVVHSYRGNQQMSRIGG